MNIRNSLLATTLSLSLVAGYPLTSQGQETQTQADTVKARLEPQPIPASDVVVRAEADNERLRELRAHAAVLPDVQDLASALPEILAIREHLLADSASQDPSRQTRRALQTLRERWTLYKEQLDEWQSRLVDRSQALGADRDTLIRIRSVWAKTAEAVAAAEEDDYPAVAAQTVDSTQATIDEVSRAIGDRLDSVLALQNEIAQLSTEAEETLARIDTAENEARLGLFTPEDPPLWIAIGIESQRFSWDYVRESVGEDLDTITGFVEGSVENLLVQFVFLFSFLILMAVLGLRARRSKIDDPEIELALGLFKRPVSATVLIFILTTRLFHPSVPIALADFMGLLALIPLLRLLPLVLQPALLRPFHVFAALWLAHESVNILPEGSVLQRLGILTVATLGLAAFIWFVRREGKQKPTGAMADLVMRLVRLGAVLLAIAIVAGILGYVDLATLLTDGTLGSVLVAAGIYAGAMVFRLFLWLLLRSKPAQTFASIRLNTNLFTRRMKSWVKIASIVAWVALSLSRFDVLQPTVTVVESVLTTRLSVGNVSISLGNILVFILAIWIATLAARFTRFVLEADVFPHLTLPRGVPGAITKLSTYVIIGLGLLIAFAAAGIQLSNIALLAGALGVGIGFGLQTIVSNFISGLILIFERPIQAGDSVQLDTLMGTVKNIGIRASTVRTFEGAEVLVPNAELIAGRVVNWTLSDRLRRLDVPVGVAYGTDPHRVRETLLKTVSDNPDCLSDPEPWVVFKGFGDSSLDFELRFWTHNFDHWMRIKSDVTYAIHDALKDASIEIPFPQRDLHVRSVDPSVSDAVTETLQPKPQTETPGHDPQPKSES